MGQSEVAPIKPQILSYGGGVQSVATAILIAEGKLPAPDLIVMADTGREASATWDYLENITQPMLRELNLEVKIAPRSLSKVDLKGHNGDILMPMFVRNEKGKRRGKLPGFCSSEWKQYVVQRYVDQWLKDRGYSKRAGVDVWFGFTFDEVNRVKPDRRKWFWRVYPLLGFLESEPYGELGYPTLSRADCKTIISSAGAPMPQKSACWMCPYRSNEEWRKMRDTHPEDFKAAVKLEEELQKTDPDVFLHESVTPLRMVDLEKDIGNAEADQCSLGFCMT